MVYEFPRKQSTKRRSYSATLKIYYNIEHISYVNLNKTFYLISNIYLYKNVSYIIIGILVTKEEIIFRRLIFMEYIPWRTLTHLTKIPEKGNTPFKKIAS